MINLTADVVLATKMVPERNDAGASTIHEYLTTLLLKVWDENENFDGKRPFGNSSWDYELAEALIEAGLIEGTLDSDGYLESCNRDDVDILIREAIGRMGRA